MKKMYRMLPVLTLLLALSQPLTGHNLKVWMSSPTLTADGVTVSYLTVFQTDFDGDSHVLYSDFQMQLNVPEGITLAKKKSGRTMVDDVTLNADRFEGLTSLSLGCSQASATSIKFTVTGTSTDTYYPDDADGTMVEELFTVGLLADANMQNGTYEISLSDVKFVLPTAAANVPTEDMKATLTITGGQGSSGDVLFTMSEVGYATLILPFDAAIPEGLHAYTCTGVDAAGDVTLVEQDAIAANVPLLMVGTVGSYNFSGTGTATETSYTTGILTGVYESTEITSGYVLQKQGDDVAFYRVDVESPITVPANRCYLTVSSPANSLSIRGTTGIVNQSADNDDTLYGLQGRSALGGVMRGIYIRQGKKIVIH